MQHTEGEAEEYERKATNKKSWETGRWKQTIFFSYFSNFLKSLWKLYELNPKAWKAYSMLTEKTKVFSLVKPASLKSLIPISKDGAVFSCCIGLELYNIFPSWNETFYPAQGKPGVLLNFSCCWRCALVLLRYFWCNKFLLWWPCVLKKKKKQNQTKAENKTLLAAQL